MKRSCCWAWLLLMMLCLAANSYGQQSTSLDPPAPQSTQATQNANGLQNSQTSDLQNQPGLFDTPQATQTDTLNQPQGQLTPPQRYEQQGGVGESAGNPDRSIMRDTPWQANEAGTIGNARPGELGVYLVEAAGPGVVIRQTVVGSAAAEAGLEPGDAIVRINGAGVEMPSEITRLIRAIPAGEPVTLHIWRDGQEQQITATLQPAGERYRVGFRNETVAMNGDLDSRTRRLEQQLVAVIQELRQLREEMAQLRTGQARSAADVAERPLPGSQQPGATAPGIDTGRFSAEPIRTDTPSQTPPTNNDTGLPF